VLIIRLVLALVFSSMDCRTEACADISGFKELMAGASDTRNEYRGRYQNFASWYSIRIPAGLKGYDGRDEPRHSGFGIGIGKNTQGVIFVSGDSLIVLTVFNGFGGVKMVGDGV
jgi:hypothetical protein